MTLTSGRCSARAISRRTRSSGSSSSAVTVGVGDGRPAPADDREQHVAAVEQRLDVLHEVHAAFHRDVAKGASRPELFLELVVQASSPSARVGAPIADEDPSALASARRPSCPRGGVGRHRDRIAGFHRNGIGADGRSPVVVMADGPGTVTARADACSATRRAPWSRSQRRCAPTPAGSLTRTFGGMERLPVSGGPDLHADHRWRRPVPRGALRPSDRRRPLRRQHAGSADRERAAVSAAMRDRRSAGRASGVSGRAPPLHARRPEAAAGGEWNPGLCDIPVSTSRCEVVAGHLRWTSLRFGTADFPQDIPPAVVVRFGVRKSGGKGVRAHGVRPGVV